MNRKKFDCVEMMHKAQAEERKVLKGMTLEQKLEYWRKIEDEMIVRRKNSQSKRAVAG